MTQAIAKLERENRYLREKDIALVSLDKKEDLITLPCFFAGEISSLGISHEPLVCGLVYIFEHIALIDNPFLGHKFVEGQNQPEFKYERMELGSLEPGETIRLPIYCPRDPNKFLGYLDVRHEKYERINWVVAE